MILTDCGYHCLDPLVVVLADCGYPCLDPLVVILTDCGYLCLDPLVVVLTDYSRQPKFRLIRIRLNRSQIIYIYTQLSSGLR